MDRLGRGGDVATLLEQIVLDAFQVPAVVAGDLLGEFQRQQDDLLATILLAALPRHHDLGAHAGDDRVEDRFGRGAFAVARQYLGRAGNAHHRDCAGIPAETVALGEGREGAFVALGEAQGKLGRLAHRRHVARVRAGAADVAQGQLQGAADAGIGACTGADGVGQSIDAERACDRAVDAERHRRAAGGRGDTEKVEVRFEDRGRGRQHDRQLGRNAARDHALIGDAVRRDVAEHRRHHAQRFRTAADAGDHGLKTPPGWRHQGEAVGKLGLRQDALCVFPVRPVGDDGPAAPLVHQAMRVQATVVPPKDGMKAECLPGPPATVM